VVDTEGRVIGRHFGLPLYTIGQRHGFEINVKSQMSNVKSIPPFYVIGKDIKKNRLIVGFGKETEKKEFLVEKVNWINPIFKLQVSGFKLFVRIRHQGELLNCQIVKLSNCQIKVILDEPYRGIAPGQAAVFYKKVTNCGLRITGLEVVGGGIIKN